MAGILSSSFSIIPSSSRITLGKTSSGSCSINVFNLAICSRLAAAIATPVAAIFSSSEDSHMSLCCPVLIN